MSWSDHPDKGVLLLHRHRFITDTEGYQIPAGGIDPGESVEQAAAREVLEEHCSSRARHGAAADRQRLWDGVSDQRFHFVLAHADSFEGAPADAYEATSRVWVDRAGLNRLLGRCLRPGAPSTVALLHALHFGHL